LLIALPFALIAMPATVKLDDEPCIGTEEIRDVRTNRVPPPELGTIQMKSPQPLP